MFIRTPDGREIPFKLVGKIEESISSPSITRINRKRAINITADVDISKANSNEIVRNLQDNFLPDLLSQYPYVSYSLEGEQRQQNENLESLGSNYLLALILVYMLLAIPFKSYIQPLVVMSAIPFGIIGAVVGHLLLAYRRAAFATGGMSGGKPPPRGVNTKIWNGFKPGDEPTHLDC